MFEKIMARGYTPQHLQDPLHIKDVITYYIRGLHCGDVREKVYDSNPQTLQEAMERSHTYSHSRGLRAERNGPYTEGVDTARREEPMDVAAINPNGNSLGTDRRTISQYASPPSTERREEKTDDLEEVKRQIKGVQKQIGKLVKDQWDFRAEITSRLSTVQHSNNRQQTQPQGPDRRKWAANGDPYCLKCGGLGHIGRFCTNGVNATHQPPNKDQGN